MAGPDTADSMWIRRRRIAAAAQAAVLTGLPFVEVRGESALRFDLPGLRLLFFGTVLRIDEFHLVALGTLFLLLLGIAVTVGFGRIWCGWLCGQTVLPLLASWGAERIGGRWEDRVRKVLLFFLCGAVSLSLLWYFLPPAESVPALARSRTVQAFFGVQWAAIWLLVSVAGPRFCRTVCPYSMLQNVLFDRNTLVIAFDGNRAAKCLRCDLCVHVCPVSIDIKEGLRRECIACAECIDACRFMTGPRGIEPFLAYRGTVPRGKTAALGALAMACGAVFLASIALRPEFRFLVRRADRFPGGAVGGYSYTVQSNRGSPLEIALRVEGGVLLSGAERVFLPPYGRTTGQLAVRKEEGVPVRFVARGESLTVRREIGSP